MVPIARTTSRVDQIWSQIKKLIFWKIESASWRCALSAVWFPALELRQDSCCAELSFFFVLRCSVVQQCWSWVRSCGFFHCGCDNAFRYQTRPTSMQLFKWECAFRHVYRVKSSKPVFSTRPAPIAWKVSSVGQIWSQMKKSIFLKNTPPRRFAFLTQSSHK